MNLKKLGKDLDSARRKLRLTKADMYRIAGLTRHQCLDVENGRRVLTLGVYMRYAAAVGKTIELKITRKNNEDLL